MRHLLAAALSLFIAAPAMAVPTGIYFFGDSLTDVGNITALNPGVPGYPYDPQGRASNGPIYADVLAAGFGNAATPSVLGGNDFAYGGARTRYQVFGSPFQGILEQVTTFTAPLGSADSGALYVLWGGSNNLQDIIVGKQTDINGLPIPDARQTLGDIASAISTLYADGARKILVPNVVDLTLVPRLREFLDNAYQNDPVGRELARLQIRNLLIGGYNAGLAGLLSSLEGSLTGLDLIAFDAFANLDQIIADATRYGFSNTTDRCYTGDDIGFTGGGEVCAHPETYMWWDGIHPTTALHAIIGERMLATVPEPGTLLLIALALGLVVARRRTTGTAGQRQAGSLAVRPGAPTV